MVTGMVCVCLRVWRGGGGMPACVWGFVRACEGGALTRKSWPKRRGAHTAQNRLPAQLQSLKVGRGEVVDVPGSGLRGQHSKQVYINLPRDTNGEGGSDTLQGSSGIDGGSSPVSGERHTVSDDDDNVPHVGPVPSLPKHAIPGLVKGVVGVGLPASVLQVGDRVYHRLGAGLIAGMKTKSHSWCQDIIRQLLLS